MGLRAVHLKETRRPTGRALPLAIRVAAVEIGVMSHRRCAARAGRTGLALLSRVPIRVRWRRMMPMTIASWGLRLADQPGLASHWDFLSLAMGLVRTMARARTMDLVMALAMPLVVRVMARVAAAAGVGVVVVAR